MSQLSAMSAALAGRVLACLLVASAAGCSDVLFESQLDELADNLERWEATRPAEYTFAIARLCFCGPEARGPVRVTVAGSVVVSQHYVDSGEPVQGEAVEWFPDVDGLFAILGAALEGGAFDVRVSYDASTGVPIDVWIDYDQNTVDEELGFEVTEAVH